MEMVKMAKKGRLQEAGKKDVIAAKPAGKAQPNEVYPSLGGMKFAVKRKRD